MSSLSALGLDLDGGLARVSETPVGRGSIELLAGATTLAGPFARLQAEYHPFEQLGAFAFAGVDRDGAGVGAGIKLTF